MVRLGALNNLYRHRNLIRQFAWRDLVGRYKGSYLGIVWSLISPLMMLAVYTFVFSVVLKAKWGAGTDRSQVNYALTLFCGLAVFNVFSECVSRAPGLLLNYASYVKKVVFPLEILPVACMISSLVNAGISLALLIPVSIVLNDSLPHTIYCLPLVLLPLCALSLGCSWFLAALGVFIRDTAALVNVIVAVLLFTSGVFFPMSFVPEQFRWIVAFNPLCAILEDARRTILWGEFPLWGWWFATTAISALVMHLGYYWFMRTKGWFADVI